MRSKNPSGVTANLGSSRVASGEAIRFQGLAPPLIGPPSDRPSASADGDEQNPGVFGSQIGFPSDLRVASMHSLLPDCTGEPAATPPARLRPRRARPARRL